MMCFSFGIKLSLCALIAEHSSMVLTNKPNKINYHNIKHDTKIYFAITFGNSQWKEMKANSWGRKVSGRPFKGITALNHENN